jgi:hypothetical protein
LLRQGEWGHMGRGRSRRRDEVNVIALLRSKGEIERAEWLQRTGLCSLTLMELCEIALAEDRRS